MNAREWKPGDVAFSDGGYPHILLRTKTGWASDSGYRCDEWTATSLRPLVVIDPEDREQVKALCWARWTSHDPYDVDKMQATLRSLIAPAKPEEPLGLGAVVEDASGLTWVRRHPGGPAWVNGYGRWDEWENIAAVKVLSEGVTK